MRTRLSRIFVAFSIVSLFLVPSEIAAQEQGSPRDEHHVPRYRFIDLGTFGGPNSETNGSTVVINLDGTVVGQADTDVPCPYLPEFPISPAFKSKGRDKQALATFHGGCTGFPIAIGPTGLIVGSADPGIFDSDGVPEIRATLWKGRHILNLGTLGGDNSLAVAVNSHGQIVSLSANAILDNFSIFGWKTQTRTVLWEKGVMHDLGTLGGPDSAGGLINERGQIAGSSYTSNIPNPIATFCGENIPPESPFLWDNGKMTNLGSLGGTCGIAAVLNNRGQVVGFSDLEGDQTGHPFLWTRGKMRDLGTLGGTFGIAGWISDSEEIIGASTTANDALLRGFFWRHGRMINLGSLDGDDCSDAFVVNGRGQVIGPSFDCNDPGNTHAYLWDKGRMFDLNAFVPPGLSLQLADPHYINDLGEITVVGMLPSGSQHAIVLVPCSGSSEEGCRKAAESRQAIGRMRSTSALGAGGKRTGFDPRAVAAKFHVRRTWMNGMRSPTALHK